MQFLEHCAFKVLSSIGKALVRGATNSVSNAGKYVTLQWVRRLKVRQKERPWNTYLVFVVIVVTWEGGAPGY